MHSFLSASPSAFRRSELAAIEVTDLSFCKDGIVIDLRRSKTDQEARGRQVGIPFGEDAAMCPVHALRRWLKEAHIKSGAVFRAIDRRGNISARALNRASVSWILKRAARRARMDTKPFGGHSLRAGCVTQAAMNGANERDIMRQTGHKSPETLANLLSLHRVLPIRCLA